MMKKAIILFFSLVVALTSLVLVYRVLGTRLNAKVVKIAEVTRGDLVLKVKAPGFITSRRIFTVTAPIAGEIKGVSEQLVVGSGVKKNEVLCYIVPTAEEEKNLLEDLKFAEMNFELAEKDLEVAKRLYEMKAISYQEYRAKEISFLREKSNLDKLRAKLEPRPVYSPIDGILVKIEVKNGQIVNGGKDLFVVADLNSLVAVLNVFESDINRVYPGMKGNIIIDGEVKFTGEVENISLMREEASPGTTPTYKVYVNITEKVDPTAVLRLGETVVGELVYRTIRNVMVLPLEAINYEAGSFSRTFVYVYKNGRAKRRYVSVGETDGVLIEIKGGLKEGEKVITYGSYYVKDGEWVKVEK